ncbi:MAG: PIG-L family deacetylase, partial [Burkholderiales bacterium]|nr:PIG-L family deacetylase [Burkholderiales bacterium]
MNRSTSLPEPDDAIPPGLDGPLCPLPAHLPLAEATRVLAFAPHPDDEAIGCGGALAQLAQAGVPLRVVLVTDGAGAGALPAGTAVLRQREFVAALRTLGVADHALLGFPDGGLTWQSPLLAAIQQQVDQFAPTWILSPSRADAHRDHRVVAQAVLRAARA